MLVIVAQTMLVAAAVPPAFFPPESIALQQLANVHAGLDVQGLYPYLALFMLRRLPFAQHEWVYALRTVNVILGTLTLMTTWLGAVLLFPDKPYVPPGTLAVLGTTPAFVLASSQATPEVLLALLVLLALVAGLWAVRRGLTVFELGLMAVCFLAGVQLDWGFWWLAIPLLLAVFLAMFVSSEDRGQWVAQASLLAGAGVALTGGILVLQGSRQLIPVLSTFVNGVRRVVQTAQLPTAAVIWDLFRRYWAGPTEPGWLWYSAVLLWTMLAAYGMWRFDATSFHRDTDVRRRAEYGLTLIFGVSLLLGALLVRGSVTTWPAPLFAVGGLALTLGWSHVAPARVRPQWLLVGLFILALLHVAALMEVVF